MSPIFNILIAKSVTASTACRDGTIRFRRILYILYYILKCRPGCTVISMDYFVLASAAATRIDADHHLIHLLVIHIYDCIGPAQFNFNG